MPYTGGTHHFIGERELKLMKETAYLINTARGPIVDEKALGLFYALEHGVIAGAGLDVYEREPQLEPGLKRSVQRRSVAAHRKCFSENADEHGDDGGPKCIGRVNWYNC